jgi:hypothetical protein
MNIKRMLAIAAVAVMIVPSAAFAQSGAEGYGGQQNVVAGLEEDSGAPPPAAPAAGQEEVTPAKADRGALPFTGADLGVLMAAGSVLLALGFGLRRLTHRPFQV